MKSTRTNTTPHAAMHSRVARETHPTNGEADAVSHRLQQALAELAELKQTLATSQKESIDARQQIGIVTDTNARLTQQVKQLEQELVEAHHFAYHDELTGLPNRSLLRDRLNQALAQAARQNKQVGLLLLDLDGFKSVNDMLGHATGDKILQRVAERLLSCIREADTACRYGGDEFVILLPEVDGEKSAAEVAQKLRVQLARPYLVDDQPIAVTASIGVAVYPRDGSSQDDLIRRADIAMYLAKAHTNSPIRSAQQAARS